MLQGSAKEEGRQRKRARLEEEEEEDEDELPKDTVVAFNSVKTMLSDSPFAHVFVFQHQIYGLLTDKGTVDMELTQLRSENKYKFLYYTYGGAKSGQVLSAIIEKSAYLKDTEIFIRSSKATFLSDTEKDALTTKFQNWLANNTMFNINHNDLIGHNSSGSSSSNSGSSGSSGSGSSSGKSSRSSNRDVLQETDVQNLLRFGFLRVRNDRDSR